MRIWAQRSDTALALRKTLLSPTCGKCTCQPGLLAAVLGHDAQGNLIRRAGIMGVVIADGEVYPGDPLHVILPPEPHHPLERV